MLTLIQYPPAFGASSASPFCVKVEILLKLAGLEYELEELSDPRKMPYAKLPVLRDGQKLVPDSVCIREYLEDNCGAKFDGALSTENLAISHAFTRLCEERLYWVILYSRWMDTSNWAVIRQHFFGDIPWPGNLIAPKIAHKQVRQALNGQGIGRHTPKQIYNFGIQDLEAVSNYLGGKAFLMGAEVGTVDATAFAFLSSILLAPLPSPLKSAAEKMENLAEYCQRVQKHFSM